MSAALACCRLRSVTLSYERSTPRQPSEGLLEPGGNPICAADAGSAAPASGRDLALTRGRRPSSGAARAARRDPPTGGTGS